MGSVTFLVEEKNRNVKTQRQLTVDHVVMKHR